jgi:hypothetical protein
MNIHRELLDILIREEIQRIVSDAARGTGFLRAGEHAYRIAKAYPNCGLTGRDLVNRIAMTAAKSGVAVELRQPSLAA